MPDTFGASGLQVKTLSEIKTELESAYREIYGQDISLDPDTPDGQLIGILAQQFTDMREKLMEINASFDPEQAVGAILDQRVGINGIQRNEGTYTRTPVTITTDRAVSLSGAETASPFTIKDDSGTQFVLEDSEDIAAAGDHILTFRAKNIGAVLVGLNTITTAETIIAGITAINNPDPVIIVGQDEESDQDLKERRKRSISISSSGYTDSIEAALANLSGVTTVTVEENTGDTTDENGTPPHTLWILVEGGDDDEIAQTIYAKKSAGAGMRGDEEITITRTNGRPFTAKFDRPQQQNLYIRFNLTIPDGLVDTDFVKNEIVENIIWGTGDDALGDVVTAFVKSLDERFRITGMELSKNGSDWSEIVSPDSIIYRFVNDQTRITIT